MQSFSDSWRHQRPRCDTCFLISARSCVLSTSDIKVLDTILGFENQLTGWGAGATPSLFAPSQVTDLLVDESSFTGEAEPSSKTDTPLTGEGDLTTLSNIVFMGTLVQCGKGQVSPGAVASLTCGPSASDLTPLSPGRRVS